jgi:hypothetical protein
MKIQKRLRFLFITFKFKTVRDLFMLVRDEGRGGGEVESKAHTKKKRRCAVAVAMMIVEVQTTKACEEND